MTISTRSSPFDRWVYGIIILHMVVWTLTPIFVRHNLPLDAIEGTIWGHQLEWGYDKNPFLNGWLTAFATYLDGQQGWMLYLFSQLSVAICLVVVYRLAKQCLNPAYAVIAVLMLETVQYFNLHAIDFNDNTLELSLWALAIYSFYHALRTPSKFHWVLTGVWAALGMMAKYYTAALLAGMALFLFIDKKNRAQLKTWPPYWGLAIFLLILLPHCLWLFKHEFITITYVFERASSPPHWTNHFFYPFQFAWQQLQTFFPAMLICLLLTLPFKPQFAKNTELSRFNQAFLWYVAFGPFVLTLLLSLLTGSKLRAGWGMPLLSFWGILFLAYLQPVLSLRKVYGFVLSVGILILILAGGYAYSLIHAAGESSANFPGKEIATTLTTEWRAAYHTPLPYVAGSRWLSGNISFYSPDHPPVFIEWNHARAPWINIADMQKQGGVFVWNIDENESLPAAVKQQFPRLRSAQIKRFLWRREGEHLPPIQIGVAILPPA